MFSKKTSEYFFKTNSRNLLRVNNKFPKCYYPFLISQLVSSLLRRNILNEVLDNNTKVVFLIKIHTYLQNIFSFCLYTCLRHLFFLTTLIYVLLVISADEFLFAEWFTCKRRRVSHLDTGRKLNVHSMFIRGTGRLLNVLYMLNYCPVSRELYPTRTIASPSQASSVPQAELELANNLSSDFAE